MKNLKLYEQHLEDPIGYARFKMVADANGAPIDADILEANPVFEKYMSMSLSEMKSFRKFELLAGCYEGRDTKWLTRYHRVASGGGGFVEMVYIKGLSAYFELGVHSPIQGEFIILFKKVNQQSKINPVYDQVLNHLPTAIFLTDLHGKIQYASPGVEEVFGYHLEEVIKLGNVEKLLGNGGMKQLKIDPLMAGKSYLNNVKWTIKDRYAKPKTLLLDMKRLHSGRAGFLIGCKDITSAMKKHTTKDSLSPEGRFTNNENLIKAVNAH